MGLLRAAALIAIPVGALGSAGLLLRAGRNNPSRLLMTLFVCWVSAPFVALLWVTLVSKDWSVVTRTTLHCATLLVTLISLSIYTHAVLRPPAAQGAFVFVMVPPMSCVLLAIVIPLAAFLARRK